MRDVAIGFTAEMDHTDPTLAVWKADVARLVDVGATAVRTGISPWVVLADGSAVTLADEHLAIFRAGIQHARNAGLDVLLTLAATNGSSPTQTVDDVRAGVVAHVGRVVDAVGDLCRWVQVLNEWDAASWLNWSTKLGPEIALDGQPPRPGATDDYIAGVASILADCRARIRRTQPHLVVTTAVTGLAMDTNTEVLWRRMFDVVAPSIDALGINGYPYDWWPHYAEMPGRLRRTSRRYGKQILLTEIGLPTNTGTDVETVMEWLAHQVDRATRSTDVAGVWLYELRDRGTDPEEPEDCFGVYYHDGTPKPGWRAVRAMIRSVTDNIPRS